MSAVPNIKPKLATNNKNSTIIWSWESKPFGETKPNEDIDNDGNKFTLNLRFPGQYFDAETNKHYNINRDYDPITGRYIQSDPIGFEGGSNSYLYAGGNPIVRFDESGLEICYYFITTHILTCIGNKDNEILMYSDIVSERKKDGMDCRNNASDEYINSEDIGPVPLGNYNIYPNNNPGHEGWWSLQDKNWIPVFSGLMHKLGFKRAGFNIHLGSVSWGYITIKHSKNGKVFFKNYQICLKEIKKMKFMYLNKIGKLFILIVILFILYLIYRTHIIDKSNQIVVALKTGKYKEAFDVAKSTELFSVYNYNSVGCSVIVEYYLIGVERVVEQNFTKAEEYCLKCKGCSLKFMYQEAIDYYCNTNEKEYRILGILKKTDNKKCQYCKKRLKDILRR